MLKWKEWVIWTIAVKWSIQGIWYVYKRGFEGTGNDIYRTIFTFLLGLAKKTLIGHRIISAKQEKLIEEMIESTLTKSSITDPLQIAEIPKQPIDKDIIAILDRYKELDKSVASKLSGTIYQWDELLDEVSVHAFRTFLHSNPLHSDLFCSTVIMEQDLVRMGLSLFALDEKTRALCVGMVTSGGTESIMLAVKAHRDWARAHKFITNDPEMIVPVTAHVAFYKAAECFGIKLIKAPIRPTPHFCALAEDVESLITCNTIMLIASVPCFPYGTADDFEGFSKLAKRHSIGLHLDICLGSFWVPMVCPQLNANFSSMPGVTSISCDLHKYGFTPKGTSLVLYRDSDLMRFQCFAQSDWVGGIYASPGLTGSRPGSLIAATWASILACGKEGYEREFKKILETAAFIKEHCPPELSIIGRPIGPIIAFKANEIIEALVIDAWAVMDKMCELGWYLNTLQSPPAFHLAITALTDGYVFIEDLQKAIKIIKKEGARPVSKTGKMYGTTTSIPDQSLVNDLAKDYLIKLYNRPWENVMR